MKTAKGVQKNEYKVKYNREARMGIWDEPRADSGNFDLHTVKHRQLAKSRQWQF